MPGDHLATLRLGYMRHGICIGCGQVVSLSLKGFKCLNSAKQPPKISYSTSLNQLFNQP